MAQNNDATITTSASANQLKKYPFSVRDKIGEQLYLNPEMSDVNFLFPSKDHQSEEDGEQSAKRVKKPVVSIPAHKLLLKTGSKVFHEMFNGDWKESKEVEIVDATPEAFKEFLQFFYLGSGTFTKENIDRVMYLADKYMIDDSLNVCSSFLMDAMTLNDACSCYALSVVYKQSDLKKFCERKIICNAKAVFDSEDFLDCNRNTLAEIIKLDIICDETIVFDGCMKWAKNACKKNNLDESNTDNLRSRLGECLYLIRFGNMTLEELCKSNLKYSNLLHSDEWLDATNCIGLKHEYKSKIFFQKPRLSWNESNIWRCQSSQSGQKIISEQDTVQFISNKMTLLGGLYFGNLKTQKVVFGMSVPLSYSIGNSIEIIKKSSALEEMLFSGTIRFDSDNSADLKFSKPIIIIEGIKYVIRLGKNIKKTLLSFHCGKVKSPKGLEIDFYANGGTHFISGLDLMDI